MDVFYHVIQHGSNMFIVFIHTYLLVAKETEICNVIDIINWLTYGFYLISVVLLYSNEIVVVWP
jgi:hypothetical protein